MPAARKPRGVAMPPGMRKGAALIYASVPRQPRAGRTRARRRRPGPSGHDHRVLTALPELRTLHAVGIDFFRQPEVRHDREAHVNEIAGHVVNAHSFSKPSRRARRRSSSTIITPTRLPRADPSTASERTSATCGLSGASSAAADDLARSDGDDELIRAHRELAERPRQQMTFLEVRLDQREQLFRVGRFGRFAAECVPAPVVSFTQLPRRRAPHPVEPTLRRRRLP